MGRGKKPLRKKHRIIKPRNMNPVEILKNHQVKKTLTRISVIKILQESKEPMSEMEIKEFMQDSYDRITFYRTIQTLMNSGIIHRIVADNVTVKYALNCCEESHRHVVNHVHFYCTNCQAVTCLEEVKVEKYILPIGFEIKESDVVIKGLCNKCSSSHEQN